MFMRTLRIKVILISLFLLLFSALNLRAQAQQEDKITVMGMVSDQFLGIPLKAKVYLLGQDSTSSTPQPARFRRRVHTTCSTLTA